MFRGKQEAAKPSGAVPQPASQVEPDAVRQDWEQREFTQSIQLGVTQLTAFLNDFDSATRGRLAALSGKLEQIERRVTLVEATLQTVHQDK
mmetsp:Transcript_26767/g.58766  ORF Transcript_26767/g.58766 Transcript_26767/m.58766 type:complete len:91 (+) Transcript_26767:128-400(+)|eukprot:6213799-Pleurochrysis_carterae.AAC.3